MENTLDLNENDNEGRILVLEPNEKIEYRFLISKIPKGNYEIAFDSSSGYGESIERFSENCAFSMVTKRFTLFIKGAHSLVDRRVA